MAYKCSIIADSVSPTGKRLTTMEITFPRIVLAEFNTHRMFSRNSASSRAIPIRKMLDKVLVDPFVPDRFPANGKGMQPGSYYEKGSVDYQRAHGVWLNARMNMVRYVETLDECGVHKQIANRLLEPWIWHTVIVTATEWANFFKLRCHPDAQEQIKIIADMMYDAYHFGTCPDHKLGCEVLHPPTPKLLQPGEWHCPYVYEEDEPLITEYVWSNRLATNSDQLEAICNEIRKEISVARCARVSYLTHTGHRDPSEDVLLFTKLTTSGHWSPFEHVATPMPPGIPHGRRPLGNGNFIGWDQFRKWFPNENVEVFERDVN